MTDRVEDHGPEATAVAGQARSWRTLNDRTRPWDGGWVGVSLAGVGYAARTQLRRRAHALAWLGFRRLRPGLFVRPDNLMGGVSAIRAQLHTFGLDEKAAVFALRDLDPVEDARARRLWPTARLRASYRVARATLDPLLPSEVFPAEDRDRLVETMSRYDRAGRRLWVRFLGRHGVLPQPAGSADRHLCVVAGGRE